MGNVSSNVTNIKVNGDNNSTEAYAKFIPTTSVSVEKNSHVNEAMLDVSSSQYASIMQYMHSNILTPEYSPMDHLSMSAQEERGYGLYPSKKSTEPSSIAGSTSLPLSGLTSIVESANKLRNISSSMSTNTQVSRVMSIAKKPYVDFMKKIFDKADSTMSEIQKPVTVNNALNSTVSNALFKMFSERGLDDIDQTSSPSSQADVFNVSNLKLPTYSTSCGQKPTSNVDSILTGATTIPLSEYADVISSVAITAATTDYVESISNADLAGATFSSPNIMNVPTNPICAHVFNSLPIDSASTLDIVDHLQVSGMKYGFKTAGNVPVQSVGTNTIQNVIDSAPVSSVSAFLNIGDLRATQNDLINDTKTDILTVMLAAPKMINANIIPEVNYYRSEDMLSILDTIDIPTTPLITKSMYYVNSKASSTVSNATAISTVKNALDSRDYSVQSIMDNGFLISTEFSKYSSVITIKFDFATNGLDIPGYICVPMAGDGKPMFVPAVKEPGTRKSYKTTISTANILPTKMFSGYSDMHFILCSVVSGPRVDNLSSCITINSEDVVSTPTTPTATLPCWYYDGKPVHNPLLQYAFTVTPNYQGVSHPCDVTKAYSYLLAPYAPYIPHVVNALRSSKFPILEASFEFMCKQTFTETDETAVASYTKEQCIEWLCSLLYDLPDLMIYRGSSPFSLIESKHVPALAYKVLSIMCAVLPVTAFMFPNNATLISASSVLTDYASHKDVNISTLVDSDEMINAETESRKGVRLSSVSSSRLRFIKTPHHLRILATAGH